MACGCAPIKRFVFNTHTRYEVEAVIAAATTEREREKRGDDDGGKVKGTAERAGGLCQVVLLWVF